MVIKKIKLFKYQTTPSSTRFDPKRVIFGRYLTINKRQQGAENKKPCFPSKNGKESRIIYRARAPIGSHGSKCIASSFKNSSNSSAGRQLLWTTTS